MNAQKAEELKEQGNECIKKNSFMEAVIHYTHGIKMDPTNHLLYSNRSFAFFKAEQYYLAWDDAKHAIKLQPTWPKGYFRKGEVEFVVGQYNDAILSYNKALVLNPADNKVRDALNKTKSVMNKEKRANARMPWKYSTVGGVVGLCIVIADSYLPEQPSIQYTVLQLVLILVFAMIGYGIALVYRSLLNSQKSSLLEPPIDLLAEMQGQKEEDEKTTSDVPDAPQHGKRPHRKGGATAARHRYKQAKS